ncbi:MAG: CBS domain-containing protein [Desulfobacterales bacterium]|nr:CBS domain-containing protein [Desulfobacterales bacterium]
MFISRSMTRKVITIDENTNILDAKKKMAEHRIRHLPVVTKDNRLCGIVTDRDIRSAMPSSVLDDPDRAMDQSRLARIKVTEIMTKNPVTLSPRDTLQDALLMIQEKKVGAFTVVDEQGILKGILSTRDLMRAFINVLGIGEPGTLLCILVEEKIGQMKKIVDAVTEENISFGSILVARYWEKGKRAVFPYLLTLNVTPVKKKLEKMGFTLLDPMEWYLGQLPKND